MVSKLLAWLLTTPLFRPLNENIWARNQKVDLKEFKQYPDLLTYFTRDPKGFNPKWDSANNNNSILSPVQGIVVSSGYINKDKSANVMNGKFNIDAMLNDKKISLHKNPFMVIFLAPTDVHNVYFPFKSGKLIDIKHISGKYLLTNPYAIHYSSKVYQKNYRVSFKFKLKDSGNIIHIVMISANLVGVIETKLKIGCNVSFGDKVGNFLLGSTVVIITDNHKIKWNKKRGEMVDIMTKLN